MRKNNLNSCPILSQPYRERMGACAKRIFRSKSDRAIRGLWFVALVLALFTVTATAQQPTFHALAFWTTGGETDHSDFARQAIAFYTEAAARDHFDFRATTDWKELNPETLAHVDVVLWLNDQPHTDAQRTAFESYMNHGGGWLGSHVSGYNDRDTKWRWFVDFFGGAVFNANNWPPLPAQLIVDVRDHPVTHRLPATFLAPSNEWYVWKPSARANANVKVLISFDPANYPLGFKDRLLSGDMPVVWTNTKYRMLYVNMGHGDKIFTNETQNHIFEDGLLWLGNMKKQ
ncbi:ThuA domain-containing protein [Terriglobus saanensis]|uniref:YVTN beta-propeller repeat-containing protein n=1 Tax=Terriglobus saanensis (strain ATCC BAA-1853 / DSM 23119 / SP1PR4) TaxID=401053 RepID=E8V1E9_TERSS|nr:ThuA domain-containing protein [Terriglobus saanensis]ADV81144.1 YVTN beta-propeller repeat-containing protein [Terriglobus saanensis SP1PR4]